MSGSVTEPIAGGLDPSEAALLRALREIRSGSIEAVVHAGRIVHFERRERVRFTADPTSGGSTHDALSAARPDRRRPSRSDEREE